MGDVAAGNDRHCKDAAAELIENAAKEAGAYLNDSITNIFDKIENTANNKISEIGDDVKNI